MRITCVGGGPAGLYFAVLATLREPGHQVTVVERNLPDVTYGWGFGYWDDLLAGLDDHDPPTAREIRAASVRWAGQQVRIRDRPPVHLGGYGYGMSRHALLGILTRRARELGVVIEYQREVVSLDGLGDADLVVLSDGHGSRLRRDRAAAFGTTEVSGTNMHAWLGTAAPFPSFTFAFEPTEAGWLWFHGYQYGPGASTAIVECSRSTWSRLGFDTAPADAAVERLSEIFTRHLGGHALRGRPPGGGAPAAWRSFTTVANSRWYAGNVVLIGDAAHTAHFSVGSGTKLALQDAMVLARALDSAPGGLEAALGSYEEFRRPSVARLQEEAARSAAWFENADQHLRLEPVDVGYSLRRRRAVSLDGSSPELQRSGLGYRLHLATQHRVGRAARSAISAAKRRYARQARRR
ncbi:FAD-dependent monooxygenase [Pseudonocardia petroleophila]|uniref:FAD-dependent monooxygenase n=1 Tax=Pseudonocardia petroleophila TaxID=37331 RepID=A0A7G7MQD8_9PSEU|nr:FAD-dependent monooxygenase [Pseudonocardia petroleophila]QNG54999.1 FAD-dependent monooxygenase [Pseudonocardia petroleophila]